jgi:phospholipid/cholesterol/gamma-HCH transport system substrate-binding protein
VATTDVAPPAPAPASGAVPAPPDNLEFKAALLLGLLVLLIVGAGLYLGYARGAFDSTQQLVLVAEDAEGVGVGSDLSFAGFPIGRVRRIELAADGNARIVVDVPLTDAHWLRSSSVFTLVRGVVGNTSLHAFTGVLSDPPLADGAVRTVLVGDATAEIPKLMAEARQLLQNLNKLSSADAPLSAGLANLQAFTERLKGPGGALGALMGNDADAKRLLSVLDRSNMLLARLDGLAAKADTQVFGNDGLLRDARATVAQLNGLLGDARASLQQVDAVLRQADTVGANVSAATADLGTLRAQVETSLRQVDGLINELNRKWPFKRDTEVKLP